MGSPYSLDLRKKVLQIYMEEEISQADLAKRLKISLSSVVRYLRLNRESGDIKPRVEGKGRPGKLGDLEYEVIRNLVKNNPAITLSELSDELYKSRKIRAGRSILSRACAKLNLRYKKMSRYASERDKDDVKKKREYYREEIGNICATNLIFLDESGANLQMSPLYGRGYGKSRVNYAAPFNRGKRLTLISAISFTQIEAALYGEWNANGEIFLQFIRECLCPILSRKKVVVMDNVAFHQVAGVREAIEATGARLIYLPPYSPDLNPIENMWGKIKNSLRKSSARTVDQFALAIKTAFQNIGCDDLQGWYKHCGY